MEQTKNLIRKVPEITVYFWIIKIFTTAQGESLSDYLVTHFNPYIAVICGALGLFICLIIQLRARTYNASIYWLTVVMVAIFGTMAADVTHIVFGVPYLVSSTVFSVVLIIIFIVWYSSEKTLSIHSIRCGRREYFYWATVLATFALGTAVGDLTASTFNLGYLPSGILFAVLFILPFFAVKYGKINTIFAFWFSYIVTRPLGASFADWFGKPFLGGLGFGDGKAAFILTVCIILLVVKISFTKDNKRLHTQSA